MPEGPFQTLEVFPAAFLVGFLGYFFLLAAIIGSRQEARIGRPPVWLIMLFLTVAGVCLSAIFWPEIPQPIRLFILMFEFVLLGGTAAWMAGNAVLKLLLGRYWSGKP